MTEYEPKVKLPDNVQHFLTELSIRSRDLNDFIETHYPPGIKPEDFFVPETYGDR